MTKKSDIEELIKKIDSTNHFFVIAKEAGYLVVTTIKKFKIRMEKSGNIFQPFGKNIDKHLPIYFPVITDARSANSSEIISAFKEFEIPILYLNKRQIKVSEYEIADMLYEYFKETFD